MVSSEITNLYRIAISDVGFTSDICSYNTTKQDQTEECEDMFDLHAPVT
jgi:hypothetical protein